MATAAPRTRPIGAYLDKTLQMRAVSIADPWRRPFHTFGRRRGAAHFACKRLIDLTIAVMLLIALCPLLLLVALAIKFDSTGPVLFVQRRTGRGNRIILVRKFRTMRVREDGATVMHATAGDPRVTRVGAFLRRSSIDELPQLVNVVLGEMALVGPRPHALAHDEYYGGRIPEYGDRFAVPPGLTGLAQVSGRRGEIRSLRCMEDRVLADLAYISSWSLTLDLMILAATIGLVVNDEQAY